jgi:hypothetical protein
MRHPIDRLISQYVHEVTAGRIRESLLDAIDRYPDLVEYSQYSMQLKPFLEAFGLGSVLPVFFPRLVSHSQGELERIGRFLGVEFPLRWDESHPPQNRGWERLRCSPVRDALVQAPVLREIRQRIIPRRLSQSVKRLWRAHVEPPQLPPVLIARLREIFNADLAQLGSWLDLRLDCDNFQETTVGRPHEWSGSSTTP